MPLPTPSLPKALQRPTHRFAATFLVVTAVFLLIGTASVSADEVDAAAIYTKQEMAIIQKASNDLTAQTHKHLDAIVRNQTVHLMNEVRQRADTRAILRDKIAHRASATLKRQRQNRTAIASR